MSVLFYVAIGGFFGSITRAYISNKLNPISSIPLGTWTVNCAGSLLLGFFINLHLYTPLNGLFLIGFLGSFTTFSTFKLEISSFIHKKQYFHLWLYLLLTYIIGISMGIVGFWVAEAFIPSS